MNASCTPLPCSVPHCNAHPKRSASPWWAAERLRTCACARQLHTVTARLEDALITRHSDRECMLRCGVVSSDRRHTLPQRSSVIPPAAAGGAGAGAPAGLMPGVQGSPSTRNGRGFRSASADEQQCSRGTPSPQVALLLSPARPPAPAATCPPFSAGLRWVLKTAVPVATKSLHFYAEIADPDVHSV